MAAYQPIAVMTNRQDQNVPVRCGVRCLNSLFEVSMKSGEDQRGGFGQATV